MQYVVSVIQIVAAFIRPQGMFHILQDQIKKLDQVINADLFVVGRYTLRIILPTVLTACLPKYVHKGAALLIAECSLQ